MSKIIFHPGIGKTGTSAIQHYAYSNFLGAKSTIDLVYSPIGLDDKGVHNTFADNHPSYSKEIFDKNLDELIAYAKETDKDVFVSSEFLIRSSAPHIRHILETILNRDIQIKVVIAIRNYTDYLISSYLQAVKVKWGMKHGETLTDFCNREIDNIRMPLLVDQWSRIVGDKNISIFDYDRYKSTLLASFFSAISQNGNEINDANENVNTSIKLSYAKILLEFDRVCGDLEKRAELISFLNQCHFNAFDESPLKERVNAVVRNQYLHDFERLTARYTII